MKIVINKCYGGFSLSAAATKKLAEMNGRKCYFYEHIYSNGHFELRKYKRLTMAEVEKAGGFWTAFDIPNVTEFVSNEWYTEHVINFRDIDRADPKLIEVVETMGKKASADVAELKIIEIPDGVEYEIDEYDGMESVHEQHRSWG